MTAVDKYLASVKARLTEAHSNCATCSSPATVRTGDSGSRYYRPGLTRENGNRLVAMVERAYQCACCLRPPSGYGRCDNCIGCDIRNELDRIAGEDAP